MNLDFTQLLGIAAAPFTGGASLLATGVGAALSFGADRYFQKKAQAFEREMSSTAHQREVADLRAAGLNPILSATGGGGAAYHGVPTPNVGSGYVATALQTRRLAEEIKTMISTRANIEADTEKKEAERHLTSRMDNTEMFRMEQVRESFLNLIKEGKLLDQDLQMRHAAAAAARIEESIDKSTAGKVLRWLNRFSESVQGGGSAAWQVRRGFRPD